MSAEHREHPDNMLAAQSLLRTLRSAMWAPYGLRQSELNKLARGSQKSGGIDRQGRHRGALRMKVMATPSGVHLDGPVR